MTPTSNQSAPVFPDADSGARDLALRWNTVAVHLMRRLRKVDLAIGLPTAQASALSILTFAGPHTVTELAGFEQIATPTMTRIVTALEARGLARRSRDAQDGRLVRVTATEEGRALIEAGRLRRIERLQAAFAALSPAERTTLAGAAQILLDLPTPDADASLTARDDHQGQM
ncbi:MAG: MarR family winged helix-turn-helix transcriptional regulator [Dehalococcoidia bacterium]